MFVVSIEIFFFGIDHLLWDVVILVGGRPVIKSPHIRANRQIHILPFATTIEEAADIMNTLCYIMAGRIRAMY